jgi:hypothetical protein
MRSSYDGGQTWTIAEILYDDSLDDRNVHGGLIGSDRIVVTFNRYDATTGVNVDFNMMYSDDGGTTWSPVKQIPSQGVSSGTSHIVEIPDQGFLLPIYNNDYVELRFSSDGLEWDSLVYAWDYRVSHQYRISESCFAYLGDGKLIGLFRNEGNGINQAYLQVESYDYGRTWTNPALTNIADGFFCPSPWIIYDEERDDIIVVATDRKGQLAPLYIHEQDEVWIYQNKPSEVLGNPGAYNLVHKRARPIPHYFRFFGYASTVKKDNGDHLLILTESVYGTGGTEDAFLYQMDIEYNNSITDIAEIGKSDKIGVFPNPVREQSNITLEIDKSTHTANLELFDLSGQLLLSEVMTVINGSASFALDGTRLPAGTYICRINAGNEQFQRIITKSP